MNLEYGLKGSKRKPLIQAIEDLTGLKATYLKTPSMAYKIGSFTVGKTGTVTSTDVESLKNLKQLLDGDYGISLPEKKSESARMLTVEFPKDKTDVVKLKKIIKNKSDLFKKALDVTSLEIEENGETVSFPWFKNVSQDHMDTYIKLISALCKMSLEVKRVNETKHKAVNDKYAFRCFLLRLGFIGDEFKKDRKILLSNLEGSCAFRIERAK
ncbi:virulence protein [Gardnerella sp. DNF01205]|uniref:virulence protein n=1 Tax=Gardnerella sp. DNF01205 TaxID=2749069 RepID=UPI003BAC49A0